MYLIYRHTNNGIPSYSKMLIFWENVKDSMVYYWLYCSTDNNTDLIIVPPSRFATLLFINENLCFYSYYHISLFNQYASM